MNNSYQELKNLNQYFLDDAKYIIQERFSKDETLSWAANCGYTERFGYVLLSSERIFSIFFDPNTGTFGVNRKRTLYDKRDSLWDSLSSVSLDRGLYLPPNSILTKKEQASRQVFEVQLSQITGVNRQDYEVKVGRKTETMVSITVTTLGRSDIYAPIFYVHQDGQFIYKYLRDMSQKFSASLPDNKQSDVTSLINALAKLYQAGVLTDEEFETKKRELLSRI